MTAKCFGEILPCGQYDIEVQRSLNDLLRQIGVMLNGVKHLTVVPPITAMARLADEMLPYGQHNVEFRRFIDDLLRQVDVTLEDYQ